MAILEDLIGNSYFQVKERRRNARREFIDGTYLIEPLPERNHSYVV
jgi:hypothetical protein